jgi:glycosyltransferase involved in cell wall biosynthesis
MSDFILSICIPTYNRADAVLSLVQNILRSKSQLFEVVVLDNCSEDDTWSRLAMIKDDRLRIFRNAENIGGIRNPLKVLTLGRSSFSLLCLDKDTVNPENIEKAIQEISSIDNLAFGSFELNLVKMLPSEVYNSGVDAMNNMSFRSNHPTGMFYKTVLYRESEFLKTILTDYRKFGFYFDILNAELCFKGRAVKIRLPFCQTEPEERRVVTKSMTYLPEDLFFLPKQRFNEFILYFAFLKRLPLSDFALLKTATLLYSRSLMAATFGFRKIMSDGSICCHYDLTSRHVSKFELKEIEKTFASRMWSESVPLTRFQKLIVLFLSHVRFWIALKTQSNVER